MKRAAFTMIELIFVIVILGILAAVAIPKLAGVQDDALVSSEKTGIASARSGTAAIRGRALSRPGVDINVTVTSISGNQGYVTFISGATDATGISSSKFPNALSVSTAGISSNTQATLTYTVGEGTGFALATVLEPEGRESWATLAASGNTTIVGPASLTVLDSSAEYTKSGSWRYDPSTGIYTYQATTAYTAP